MNEFWTLEVKKKVIATARIQNKKQRSTTCVVFSWRGIQQSGLSFPAERRTHQKWYPIAHPEASWIEYLYQLSEIKFFWEKSFTNSTSWSTDLIFGDGVRSKRGRDSDEAETAGLRHHCEALENEAQDSNLHYSEWEIGYKSNSCGFISVIRLRDLRNWK